MNQIASSTRVAVWMADRWHERQLTESLQSAGLDVERVEGALGLVTVLERQRAELAIVEDRLDHLETCLASLRFRGLGRVPVIALGPGSAQHILGALSRGASDYLCTDDVGKFPANRVLARIALARHGAQQASVQFGGFTLDTRTRGLRGPGGDITLTAREFELAWVLFEHAGEVVNLNVLAQRVWGREASLAKRTIEQHVSRLRQKLMCLAGAGDGQVQLHAVHNIGYRLSPAGTGAAGVGVGDNSPCRPDAGALKAAFEGWQPTVLDGERAPANAASYAPAAGPLRNEAPVRRELPYCRLPLR